MGKIYLGRTFSYEEMYYAIAKSPRGASSRGFLFSDFR